MIKSKSSAIIPLISSLAAFAIISTTYPSFAAVWGYQGYAFDPSYQKVINSIALIVFLSLFIGLRETLLQYIFIYLFLFVLTPSLVTYSFGGANYQYLLATLAPLLFIAIFSRLSLPQSFSFSILKINIKPQTALIMSIAFLLLALPVLYFSTGGLFTFSLAEVYDLRETLTSEGLQGGISGYVILNCRNVILSLLTFSLIRLKQLRFSFIWYAGVVIAALFTVLTFAFTGSRATLAVPLYAILFSCFAKSSISYSFILSFLLVIFSFAGYLHAFIENSVPSSTILSAISEGFFKRTLLVPFNVNWHWVQYFDHPSIWTFFSDLPVIRSILGVSYDAPRRIAQDGFGWTWGSMNTGIIGSGFSDLGIIGSFINSFVTVMLLWIWSKQLTRKQVPPSAAICIAFYPITILFTSSTLTASLLGHGLLLAYILTTSKSFKKLT